MGIRRVIASVGVSALAVFGGAIGAGADDQACIRLEARLASLNRGDDFGGYGKQDAAAARQRHQLDRAIGQARASGCMGGFFLFQKRRDPGCGSLMASIERMRANLARLTASRDQAITFERSDTDRERSEILRALAFNQCGPEYATSGRRSFFETLFGGEAGGWGDNGFGRQFGGTYRTLCVRTCDGYYFPISFSTVQSNFAHDEQVCQSMCPGAEVSLYVHRSPGEESEAMVSSATGEPYTALPAAFKYRKEYDKACACGSPVVISAAIDGSAAAVESPAPALPIRVPVPAIRPAGGEDPETLANRDGRFVPKPVIPTETATPVAGLSADGRPVRVVGPSTFITQ